MGPTRVVPEANSSLGDQCAMNSIVNIKSDALVYDYKNIFLNEPEVIPEKEDERMAIGKKR